MGQIAFGIALYIGLMAAAYSYNLTFVQLGLRDLGTRVIGLAEHEVALSMGALAAITRFGAIAFGWLMRRHAWGRDLHAKLCITFLVVVAQTALTALAPLLHTAAQFWLWIVFAAGVLGIGVLATFSMAVNLVPVRWRGIVAEAITALAYFIAAVFLSPWRIELFSGTMLWLIMVGTLALGSFVFGMRRFIDVLASQSTRPECGVRRFVSLDAEGAAQTHRRIIGFTVALFAIFFIDSHGFLQLTATPEFMLPAWQSPDIAPHLFSTLRGCIAGCDKERQGGEQHQSCQYFQSVSKLTEFCPLTISKNAYADVAGCMVTVSWLAAHHVYIPSTALRGG